MHVSVMSRLKKAQKDYQALHKAKEGPVVGQQGGGIMLGQRVRCVQGTHGTLSEALTLATFGKAKEGKGPIEAASEERNDLELLLWVAREGKGTSSRVVME